MPPHAALLNQATQLKTGAEDLKTRTVGTAAGLGSKLEKAQQLETDAEQTAAGAAAASDRATKTRDAVRQTLEDINKLLSNTSTCPSCSQARMRRLIRTSDFFLQLEKQKKKHKERSDL